MKSQSKENSSCRPPSCVWGRSRSGSLKRARPCVPFWFHFSKKLSLLISLQFILFGGCITVGRPCLAGIPESMGVVIPSGKSQEFCVHEMELLCQMFESDIINLAVTKMASDGCDFSQSFKITVLNFTDMASVRCDFSPMAVRSTERASSRCNFSPRVKVQNTESELAGFNFSLVLCQMVVGNFSTSQLLI